MRTLRLLSHCGAVGLLLATACASDQDFASGFRDVEFDFEASFFGQVRVDDDVVTGRIVSADDEVLAEGVWDLQSHARTVWTTNQDDEVEEVVAPRDGVDNANLLVNELAVIYRMTDDDPDNDHLRPREGGTTLRANLHRPIGSLDVVLPRANRRARVQGWACDEDRFADALLVHIFARRFPRAPNNPGSPEYVGQLVADVQREPAVGQACGSQGRRHGFDGLTSSPVPLGRRGVNSNGYGRYSEVSVRALNINTNGGLGGANPQLSPGYRRVFFNCRDPGC